MSLICLSHSMAQPLTGWLLWGSAPSSHCQFNLLPHSILLQISVVALCIMYIFIPIPDPALNYGTLVFMFKDQQRVSPPVLCQSLNPGTHNFWVQTLTINQSLITPILLLISGYSSILSTYVAINESNFMGPLPLILARVKWIHSAIAPLFFWSGSWNLFSWLITWMWTKNICVYQIQNKKKNWQSHCKLDSASFISFPKTNSLLKSSPPPCLETNEAYICISLIVVKFLTF